MAINHSIILLQNHVARILARSGYSYVVGNDMEKWRAMRLRRGARIPNPFDPEFCDQTFSRYVSIVDRRGVTVATRAWRMIETASFVDAIESGAVWMDDPADRGWRRLDTGIDPRSVPAESGWISVGGAMQSFVPGKKLSWYLGTLH